MGTDIQTLEQLEKFSRKLTYRKEFEPSGPLDIKGFFKKNFSKKKYDNISRQEYLEQSNEVLEKLEEVGEKYGREIERKIMGHQRILNSDHPISYETAEEMLENEINYFNIKYKDEEERIKIHTWKTESIDNYDQILAEIETDGEDVGREEFLEYKKALEQIGFKNFYGV